MRFFHVIAKMTIPAALGLGLLLPTSALAVPILTGTLDLSAQFPSSDADGIEFNRAFNEVYVITQGRIERYDLTFNHLGTVTLTGGPSSSTTLGVVRDPVSGDFFTGPNNGRVHRYDGSGSFISDFAAANGNGLAYNPGAGTLLVANSSGTLDEFSLGGVLLNTILHPGISSPVGVAFDPVSNTILLGENGIDVVHEFTFAGVAVGAFLTPDPHPGNGLGMSYDAVTGNFYYAGRTPVVTDSIFVFNDPGRAIIPEPNTLSLLGLGLAGIGFRRRFQHLSLAKSKVKPQPVVEKAPRSISSI